MTRSRATPASSQIITLEDMVQNFEKQVAVQQARIAELIAVLENVYCDPKMMLALDVHHYVKQVVEGRTSTALNDLKARYEARIAELREALERIADQPYEGYATSVCRVVANQALEKPDDLSALEAVKRQARREALMEAAKLVREKIAFRLSEGSPYRERAHDVVDELLRMAEEVK